MRRLRLRHKSLHRNPKRFEWTQLAIVSIRSQERRDLNRLKLSRLHFALALSGDCHEIQARSRMGKFGFRRWNARFFKALWNGSMK
jgi:hypothetical protein